MDSALINAQPVFCQPLHGLGVDAVLEGEDALSCRVLVIVGIYRYGSLNDHRTVIQFLVHKMNCGST